MRATFDHLVGSFSGILVGNVLLCGVILLFLPLFLVAYPVYRMFQRLTATPEASSFFVEEMDGCDAESA